MQPADPDDLANNPVPGADLTTLSEHQLRQIVRKYTWQSPWTSSDFEGTPEAELLRRYPFLEGLRFAHRLASKVEMAAGIADGTVDVLSGFGPPDSPPVAAIKAAYDQALQEWLEDS